MSTERKIIVRKGQDLDGGWGTGKTFVREYYFELINVPLPLFMISPFIPAYNSLHPDYPFAIAKDSKCTKNIETPNGRGITVQTTYQVLKPNKPLTGLSGWEIDDVVEENLPSDLPAQDVTYEAVTVEETLNNLFVEKTDAEVRDEAVDRYGDSYTERRWEFQKILNESAENTAFFAKSHGILNRDGYICKTST
jgi:hypothetical protein